jgi:vacuolar protein sorting-associated protein IST1
MFNPTRAKVQLKLSVNRLQMLQNKKNMLAQQQRKEIARLLEIGKEESARIRVYTSWLTLLAHQWADSGKLTS